MSQPKKKSLPKILVPVLALLLLAVGSGALVGYWFGAEQPVPHHDAAEAQPHASAPEIHIPQEHAQEPEIEPPAAEAVEENPAQPVVESAAGWRKYAISPPAFSYRDKKLVAVIIDDAGVNPRITRQFIDIKQPVTLSFLPYAPNVARQAKAAYAKGHEVMLHLPMEAIEVDSYPGPHALTTDLTDKEVLQNLKANLDAFDTYIGVNNHMGSKFTADEQKMRLVLEEIKRRDLIFIDSKTSPLSVGGKLSKSLGIAGAERDIFLDHIDDPKEIAQQFKSLEKSARKQGTAIAIGHPRAHTLATLQEWLVRVEADDIAVVPLSVVVQEREKRQSNSH